MKKTIAILLGCGAGLLAGVLLPSNAAGKTAADDKVRPVNHRNEQYDVNKDGKLDETEIAAMKADRAAKKQARLLAKYDANKNGVLDPAEEAVHQADLEKRRQQRAERKKAKAAEKAAMDHKDHDDDDDEEDASAPAAK